MTTQTLLSTPDIKRTLVGTVRAFLEARAAMLQRNMAEAQEEANSHKGAMESRYDTFKEEAQDRKNGYAIELQKTADLAARLGDVRFADQARVGFGSLVEVVEQGQPRYFFLFAAVTLDPLMVEGVPVYAISLASPIGQALAGAGAGDTVHFRGRALTVNAVR